MFEQQNINQNKKSALRITYLLLFAIPFLIYAYTSPQYIALEDDGYFILSAFFKGVSHPPGYPIHTIISVIFLKLFPFGTIAYKSHMVSAFFGALTACALFSCILKIKVSKTTAFFCSLFFSFTPVFWSQAIISEIYTLNTFLFFLTFSLLLTISEDKNTSTSFKSYIILGFIIGLGISNHWPLFILSGTGLFFLFLRNYLILLRKLHFIIFGIVLGLIPYIWLFTNSYDNSSISFYGSIESLKDFYFYVSRSGYKGVDNGQIGGLGEKLRYAAFFCNEILRQFYSIGTILGISGLFISIRKIPWQKSTALIFSFLGSSFILILLLNFDFNNIFKVVFRVYPLISYGVFCIWLALTLDLLRTKTKHHHFYSIILLIIIIFNVCIHWGEVNKRNFTWGEEFGYTILNSLPHNSVLFLKGDIDSGVISYLRYIKGIRTDIDVYHIGGLVLGNRLFKPTEVSKLKAANILKQFTLTSHKDIFFISPNINDMPVEDHLFYKKLVKHESAGYLSCNYPTKLHDFIIHNILGNSIEDSFGKLQIINYKKHIGHLLFQKGCIPESLQTQLKEILSETMHGNIAIANGIISSDIVNYHSALPFLYKAFNQSKNEGDRKDLSDIYNMMAVIFFNQKKYDESLQLINQSINLWPTEKNPAFEYKKRFK